MTECPDDITVSELRERISVLDRDNSALKQQLGQAFRELNALKAEVADLGKAFKFEVDNVTAGLKHDRTELQHIYRYLADIHEQLWPLVRKIFPGSAATQQQIAAVIRNGGRSWDNRKNH